MGDHARPQTQWDGVVRPWPEAVDVEARAGAGFSRHGGQLAPRRGRGPALGRHLEISSEITTGRAEPAARPLRPPPRSSVSAAPGRRARWACSDSEGKRKPWGRLGCAPEPCRGDRAGHWPGRSLAPRRRRASACPPAEPRRMAPGGLCVEGGDQPRPMVARFDPAAGRRRGSARDPAPGPRAPAPSRPRRQPTPCRSAPPAQGAPAAPGRPPSPRHRGLWCGGIDDDPHARRSPDGPDTPAPSGAGPVTRARQQPVLAWEGARRSGGRVRRRRSGRRSGGMAHAGSVEAAGTAAAGAARSLGQATVAAPSAALKRAGSFLRRSRGHEFVLPKFPLGSGYFAQTFGISGKCLIHGHPDRLHCPSTLR